jgi:L-lactate dehydrogenase complex protein LldF
MKFSPEYFKSNIKESLKNASLRKNLKNALGHSLESRRIVVSEIQDRWENLRDSAFNIKKEAIDHLYSYLDEFCVKAEKNGMNIIFAKNAEEANKAILEIIKKNNGKCVVKSKSMTSEEIGLNPFLEKNNIEVVETDLGEYIIQLGEEPPSHVTAPALHKSREEIGKLFSEKLQIEYTSDPSELTKIARKILREKFLNADIGFSGVNFAIAETGSIVIIENEGNARLSNTLPDIHIALMGIEKVIPKLADLDTFMKVLPRSATGQRITSYISMISSPRTSSEIDGPKQVFIIILDNGRSDILANEKYKEALYCIRCGACMNICPIYQRVSGQSYGWVYPGPIGSVLTPIYIGTKISKDLPFGSSLCGSCSEICPVKIDIHHKLLQLRADIVNKKETSVFERMIFFFFCKIMLNPWLYNLCSRVGKFFQPLITTEKGWINVPIISKTRMMPRIAETSFHEYWKKNEQK